jgi:hypothetical protein
MAVTVLAAKAISAGAREDNKHLLKLGKCNFHARDFNGIEWLTIEL